MRGPMLAQADLVAESLVAKLAGEGPTSAVSPPRVDLQSVRRAEHLVAFHAGVGVARYRWWLAAGAQQ